MTRYTRRPSGLLVPDYEVRAFRPSAFGGRGGVFRARGPGNVVVVGGDAPTITSISPTSGPVGGAVIITGTNFISGGLVATVGGVSIAPSLTSSTRIDGILGSHANGLVDVVVTTNNGTDTLENGFTYTAAGAEGDLYEFGFEDGTAGTLKNASINPLPIAGNPWSVTSADAARGTKSLTQVVPQSSGDNGGDAYFVISPSRKSLYTRWMYKQSAAPGNWNKMLRLKGSGLNGNLGGIGGGPSNSYIVSTDSLAVGSPGLSANMNLPVSTIADNVGEWHCFEHFCDINTPGAVVYKAWIDGVQYWDYTRDDDPGSFVFAYVQFSGTKNGPHDAFTEWVDSIGVSTAYMGVPV